MDSQSLKSLFGSDKESETRVEVSITDVNTDLVYVGASHAVDNQTGLGDHCYFRVGWRWTKSRRIWSQSPSDISSAGLSNPFRSSATRSPSISPSRSFRNRAQI